MPANSASGASTSGSENQWSCGWPELSLDTHGIVAMACPPVARLAPRSCRAPRPARTAALLVLRRAGRARRRLCRRLPALAALPRGPAPALLCGLAVWAPVAYEGPARELVEALKFRGAPAVADAMAALVVANAPPGWLDGRRSCRCRCTRARRRTRGFNQAELLARASRRERIRSAGRATASPAPARTGRRSAAAAPRACRARAGPSARAGRRLAARCSSTTWSRPAPRWPRAPPRCAPPGADDVAAVVFARTAGR